MDKNNNLGVKGLADMDTRLSKLNKKVADMEDAIRRLEKVLCHAFLLEYYPNLLRQNCRNCSLFKKYSVM